MQKKNKHFTHSNIVINNHLQLNRNKLPYRSTFACFIYTKLFSSTDNVNIMPNSDIVSWYLVSDMNIDRASLINLLLGETKSFHEEYDKYTFVN